ncbi:MAG: Fe-S cluster assembly ATPase SufC [Candidatus Peregrinibacteria bacterium]
MSLSSRPLLIITDLAVSVQGKEVVHGVTLAVPEGEIHVIMGPNGSGKSSLVHALMGHPAYTVTRGTGRFAGKDILALPADVRAQSGLFLAFQHPREIEGVTVRHLLMAAHRNLREKPGARLSPMAFQKLLVEKAEELHIDPTFLERSVNVGCSGGEKKKLEMLQMAVIQPRFALLDETDSGLDIDALKVVAAGVNALRSKHFSALLVTHYARILQYIKPDAVHVMVDGKIVESGDIKLARRLEREGYRGYGKSAAERIPLVVSGDGI